MGLSCIKLTILGSLRTPKSLGELSKIVGKSKQTVVFHLKPLLESGLVGKILVDKRVCYQTSELGSLVLEANTRLKMLENVVRTAGKFFCEHDVSAIPQNVFEDLHLLDGCRVVARSNPYEFYELERVLMGSGWIKGPSSVYHDRFPEMFVSLAAMKSVELVITEDVFKMVVEKAAAKLEEYLKHGRMYVCDNIRLAFVVAEKGLVMVLYRLNGVYDVQNILVCETKDAVRWGLRLFEYYKLKSSRIACFTGSDH